MSNPTPKPSAEAAGPDTLVTNQGPVQLTPIYHASLLLRFAGKAIYVDPVAEGKYDGLPKATHILLTDIHSDHLDAATIEKLREAGTRLYGPKAVADKQAGVQVIREGEKQTIDTVGVEAVPAYNLQRGPAPGKLYHDKGRGIGYVLTFGDKRIYISGDTECTPEMKALQHIDVAFVCMNLPYTMPPSEAAQCIKAFHPSVVYPFHFKGSDPRELERDLAGTGIEVRLRKWY